MGDQNKLFANNIYARKKSSLDIVNDYQQVVGVVTEYQDVQIDKSCIESLYNTKSLKKLNITDIPEELEYPGQEVRIIIPAQDMSGNIVDNDKLALEFIYNEEGDLVEVNEPEGLSFYDPNSENAICYLDMDDNTFICPLLQSKYRNLKKRLQKNKDLNKKIKLKKSSTTSKLKADRSINIHVRNINSLDINDVLKKVLSIVQSNPDFKTLQMLKQKLLAYDLSKLSKESAKYIDELKKTIDRIEKYTKDNDKELPKNRIREFFKAIENAVREQDLLAQKKDLKESKGLYGILKRYNFILGKASKNTKDLTQREKAKLSNQYKNNDEEQEWKREDIKDDKKVKNLWEESYLVEELAKNAILYRNEQIVKIQEVLDSCHVKLNDQQRIELESEKVQHSLRVGEHQLLLTEVTSNKIERDEELNNMHSIVVKNHDLDVLSENKIVDHYDMHKDSYKNACDEIQIRQLQEVTDRCQASDSCNQEMKNAATDLAQTLSQVQEGLGSKIVSDISENLSNVDSKQMSGLSSEQKDKQNQPIQTTTEKQGYNIKTKSSNPIMTMPDISFDMAEIKRSTSKHIVSQDVNKNKSNINDLATVKKHRAHLQSKQQMHKYGKNNLPDR